MSDSEVLPGGAPLPQPNTINPVVTGTVSPGTPLYALADGTQGPARANSGTTGYCVGLSLEPASTGERTRSRYLGPVTLTAEQWAAVTAAATTLTVGAPYYVSQGVAGLLTAVKPGSGLITLVGVASSPLCLVVNPSSHTASE